MLLIQGKQTCLYYLCTVIKIIIMLIILLSICTPYKQVNVLLSKNQALFKLKHYTAIQYNYYNDVT